MHAESSDNARSPSSSPSLAPIDSSPPSSPSLTAICTPPASPGPIHPFAGSTKSNRKPRIYDRSVSQKSFETFGASDLDDDAVLGLIRPDGSKHVDATPTRPIRVLDPFSASAKQQWRPPMYEKKRKRVNVDQDTGSASSSQSSYAYGHRIAPETIPATRPYSADVSSMDDFELTDGESEGKPAWKQTKSQAEIEHEKWEEAISNAIERQDCMIDLRPSGLGGFTITHIPPDQIADLEDLTILPPGHVPSSVQPCSTSTTPSLRPFSRATTVPATILDHPLFRLDDLAGRGTHTTRSASAEELGPQKTSQTRKRGIHLCLANNSITRLPAQLFRVSALAVLSLRSNRLKTVPPQIVQLTALRELNIAQNKLRWLPAEMLQMRITTLALSGNPWISPPTPITSASDSHADVASSQHPVSETVVCFSIPPLTEFCLRSLVAPYTPPPPPPLHSPLRSPKLHASVTSPRPSGSTRSTDVNARPHHASQPQPHLLTVLEACYDLPLTEDLDISPPIFATLRTCVPAAVSRPAENPLPTKIMRADGRRDVHATRRRRADLHDSDSDSDLDDVFAPRSLHPPPTSATFTHDDDDEDEITGVSTCPSPRHRTLSPDGDGAEAWRDGRVPVFVRHAEERYTWEEEIAGVRVTETEGGVRVPVRWRGCARGCLAFLDPPPPPPPPPPTTSSGPPPVPVPVPDASVEVRADADADADGDLDVDMDVEMQDFSLGGGLADAADFDEAF